MKHIKINVVGEEGCVGWRAGGGVLHYHKKHRNSSNTLAQISHAVFRFASCISILTLFIDTRATSHTHILVTRKLHKKVAFLSRLPQYHHHSRHIPPVTLWKAAKHMILSSSYVAETVKCWSCWEYHIWCYAGELHPTKFTKHPRPSPTSTVLPVLLY